ncbi:ABC transporter ATP-binding protein [Pseudomonas sp. PDM15]|uniref:ABC transporter ATP-binding protein n=1 Tax=Pseudomonas sp. PDM15 TaxID=2769303 RepID=UPI00177E7281|nr:ABC transporter ATP-binding protein [Pseudomonas sp. PDM15]MBD9427214.1 ABC transporter ATP-binding protein [Pseudomonas sp. PDM15]
MTQAHLHLKNVDITFNGQLNSHEGFKGWLRQLVAGKKTNASYQIEALKNIDIEINQGERVGLIGLNGAGKSTLLKVMAGIYPPTGGNVKIKGHVCPMFEFATGFEMSQSGWDNIRIRGMLLGMSPEAIEAKLPEIAEFTELGEFLDYPVRTYSSGMFIRLAFAVSTSINPEILLIDEVMGAGDIAFAEKAKRRMFEFMEQGKILVFTTHNFGLLNDFCSRTIWLHKGKIVADGPTAEIVKRYNDTHARGVKIPT